MDDKSDPDMNVPPDPPPEDDGGESSSWPGSFGESIGSTPSDGAGSPSPGSGRLLEPIDELQGLEAGPYRLVELLGQGAMGVVYRGVHLESGPPRAVKVLAPGVGPFEGNLQASLQHPNIVRVEGTGELVDRKGLQRAFIIMELLPSVSALDQYVAQNQSSLRDRLGLVEQAARGVQHAHEMGVLHLDIKPSNILVDQYGTAKVADFGLAQLRIDMSQAKGGGTRAYQSPEQCNRAVSELDARTDVYALGATLYSILTDGHLPIQIQNARTAEEVQRRKIHQKPDLGKLPPQTPGSVSRLIADSLDPIPGNRPKSAGDFADALARARQRTRSPIGLARTGYVMLWLERGRFAAWAHAVVLGLLLALVLSGVARRVTPYEPWFLDRLPAIDAARPMEFRDIRVVRIAEEDQAQSMVTLAAELGVQGVQADTKSTWRALHARFIEAMAQAGARVTAFDIYFSGPEPEGDEHMAAAIRRSIDAGTPVVVGVDSWTTNDQRRPEMPQPIWDARVRWGSLVIDGRTQDSKLMHVPLASGHPDEDLLPGFVLSVFAAAAQPGAEFKARFRGDSLDVAYWTPSNRPGEQVPTGDNTELPVLGVVPTESIVWPARAGRRAGWITAYARYRVPSVAALDGATLDYVRLMRASPNERRRLVAGRVLVVVDAQADKRFGVGREREVLGGEVLASAVQSLLTGHNARLAPAWAVLAAALACAAAGAGLGVLGRGRGPGVLVRWAPLVLALALLAAFTWATDAALRGVYAGSGLLVLPVAPMLALLLAFVAGAALVLGRPTAHESTIPNSSIEHQIL